jgi:hypothetical protein
MKGLVAFRAKLQTYGQLSRVERALIDRFEWAPRNEKRFEQILGPGFDPWNLHANLPRFIEAELDTPFLPVVTRPWHQHVASWREAGNQVVFVRYEDLLADTRAALTGVFTAYLGAEPQADLIALAVDRCAFERQTGRKPGVEDRKNFARKGIAGDWRNHFSADARREFHRKAGEVLIALGYATDDAWVRDAA